MSSICFDNCALGIKYRRRLLDNFSIKVEEGRLPGVNILRSSLVRQKTIQTVTMKALLAVTLAVLLLVSCVHCEENVKEDKAEEKKPIEKVVWPGLYSWQWHPTAFRAPVHVVPWQYQPAHAWWY
ncbi:hypothetical protein NPIL_526771 [Nephila pilipes]|uniref:Uncharacterized protein n=1 Tax=Nephila pilipes TaxID=299642 RepID=A0A8X6T3D1_NEPPI|nr:hypothetical protein NPIL_526771 [Nephila pilipes]